MYQVKYYSWTQAAAIVMECELEIKKLLFFLVSHEDTVNRRFDNEHMIRGDYNGYNERWVEQKDTEGKETPAEKRALGETSLAMVCNCWLMTVAL